MKKFHKLVALALVNINMSAQDSNLNFGINSILNVSNSSWDVKNSFDKKLLSAFN